MKSSSIAPVLITLGLAACGGDDGVSQVVDASRIDAGIDAPVVCTVGPSFAALGALTPSECIQDPRQDAMDPLDDVIVLRAPLQTGSPFDELQIELWSGYGALTGGFATGTYEITGDELQYFTCGVCVFINADREGEDYVEDYFATGGSLTLTSVNGNLTGSIDGITFEHVTIDQDGMSAPAGDGCESVVTSATFTAPITAPPKAKPRQATAGRIKGRALHAH